MTRIKIASWYGDHAPGAEVEVDDSALKALTRDGVVAEIVKPATVAQETPAAEPEEAEAAPKAGRTKR